MGRAAEEEAPEDTRRAVIFWAVSRSWDVQALALLLGCAVSLGWALRNCWPFLALCAPNFFEQKICTESRQGPSMTLEMAAALPRAASGRVGVAHLLFRWHKYIYRIV